MEAKGSSSGPKCGARSRLSKNQYCAQHYNFLPKSRLNLIGAAPGSFFVWKPLKPGSGAVAYPVDAGAGAGAGAGAA